MNSIQIEQIRAEFPTLIITSKSLLKLELSNLTLIISLPQQFPSIPPVIQCVPLMSHPWIINGVIQHSNLNNWNPHTSLGRIIKDVVNEFTLRPPKQIDSLDARQIQELEEIISDQDALFLYVNSLPQMVQLNSLAQQAKDENKVLAQHNIDRNNVLESSKDRIQVLLSRYQECFKNYNNACTEYRSQVERFSLKQGKLILEKAINEQEGQGEVIATEFEQGKLNLDEFVKSYVTSRRRVHELQARIKLINN